MAIRPPASESEHQASASAERSRHWDTIYGRQTPAGVSWYQSQPSVSLELIEVLGLPLDTAVLDVGGGASTLVDALVERAFSDVSVLDVSATALELARRRLGAAPIGTASSVHWLHEDLLVWQPARRYGLWHDRAVLHFLVEPEERDRYVKLLCEAVHPGGCVIIATFAPDGPESCSGLPVARYGADDLARVLDGFEVVATRREQHTTPVGVVQPFTWIVARSPAD
jgi:SAM-dependent methyltransferase